jgi:hypothetical protein
MIIISATYFNNGKIIFYHRVYLGLLILYDSQNKHRLYALTGLRNEDEMCLQRAVVWTLKYYLEEFQTQNVKINLL